MSEYTPTTDEVAERIAQAIEAAAGGGCCPGSA